MVEIRLNQTQETIGAADSLVAGLEVEFRRWNNEVEVMGRDLKVKYLFGYLPFTCHF